MIVHPNIEIQDQSPPVGFGQGGTQKSADVFYVRLEAVDLILDLEGDPVIIIVREVREAQDVLTKTENGPLIYKFIISHDCDFYSQTGRECVHRSRFLSIILLRRSKPRYYCANCANKTMVPFFSSAEEPSRAIQFCTRAES